MCKNNDFAPNQKNVNPYVENAIHGINKII